MDVDMNGDVYAEAMTAEECIGGNDGNDECELDVDNVVVVGAYGFVC
jgi:hypothetical protein